MTDGRMPGAERRRYPRVRSFSLVVYKDSDLGVCMARTLDISKGGVRVETFESADPGARKKLEVTVSDRIFVTGGTVIHSKKTQEGFYCVGIMFDRPQPDLIGALPTQ